MRLRNPWSKIAIVVIHKRLTLLSKAQMWVQNDPMCFQR
jgi:hypothetical protein